jgi:hypothetical protein
MRDTQDAAAQFRQVLNDDPHTVYGQVASVFTRCIDTPDSCTGGKTGSDPNFSP